MANRSSLILLSGLCLLAAVVFMTIGARGNWEFILPFRGSKLLVLVTVAIAVAASTIVFQTVSANRILTPSIMGFDALYLFIQASLVFCLGGFGYSTLDPVLKFALQTGLMLVAALMLFQAVLRNASDIGRMILTGLILGVLFRSLSSLIYRLIDPSEYAVVQVANFARFNLVDQNLTFLAAGISLLTVGWIWRQHRELDVVALGRETSINLGIDHDRSVRRLLIAVSLLVSVSTALVGPIVFFGLLASALAHQLFKTWRHAILLPASMLTAITILVASQTLFERVLRLQTSVSVIIEMLGGLVFVILILRGRGR